MKRLFLVVTDEKNVFFPHTLLLLLLLLLRLVRLQARAGFVHGRWDGHGRAWHADAAALGRAAVGCDADEARLEAFAQLFEELGEATGDVHVVDDAGLQRFDRAVHEC